jgi:hypothetical protein
MADETCRAFDQSGLTLDSRSLNRFIVGADPAPRKMTSAEVKALGDPFATLVFAKGKIPRTAQQVIELVSAGVPANDPLKERQSFLVGEGSQIAPNEGVERNLRFIVTLGRGPKGPDLFLSVMHPRMAGGVEVMAWDRNAGGFNYYRSTGNALWMFAGNSRDALRNPSRGKGPFESHPSGAVLMKELKTPWQNWDSPAASILPTAFPDGDDRRNHLWFTEKHPSGAIALEAEAVRPAIERWARARFASLRKSGGTVTRPNQILEQIVGTPTANLITTHIESATLPNSDPLDLPATFFADADGLGELGLDPPPLFEVSGAIYARCIQKFDVRVVAEGFEHRGDTHFCFLVPERAFEDQVVLREAIEIGLLSKRLAACLLMVDPWNPVYSARRRSLLRFVPPSARIEDGRSRFSQQMANAILRAAKTSPAGTPEAEFAKRWGVGPNFTGEFNRIMAAYYRKVQGNLRTQAGFEAYFKLAEARRRVFREIRTSRPIAEEFDLLLPRTNVPDRPRRMQRDGTVAEG